MSDGRSNGATPQPRKRAARGEVEPGKARGAAKGAPAAGPAVRVLADAETVAFASAGELVRVARRVQAKGRALRLALSGGSTPRRTYEILAEPPFRDMIDWKRAHVFFGDERAVPPDHPDSNYGMAREALLAKVGAKRVHRMEAERADLDTAACEYQAAIARAFGVPVDGSPPSFDVVLLGLGSDGHTASLFPGTRALQERERWIVPNFVPALNAWRMTCTYPLLERAGQIVFLAAGGEKAAILAEVLEGAPDPERLPSQAVRPARGTPLWIVDAAAAAKLERTRVKRG